MKGFSSFLVEAIAALIAISLVILISNVWEKTKVDFEKFKNECEYKCYEGFIPYTKEELKRMNISVIGEGSYGEIYLNKTTKTFTVILR